MRFASSLLSMLITSGLMSCSPSNEENSSSSAPTHNPRENINTVAPYFQDTLMLMSMRGDTTFAYDSMIDTIGFLPLVSEKTIAALRKAQPLPFVLSPDTVINDERGVIVGEKLSLGSSYIQWLDKEQISRASISDERIKLTHGIQVGMSRQQVEQKLGIAPLKTDTVVFETGYMLNHCTLFFWKGHLHTAVLEDMPD